MQQMKQLPHNRVTREGWTDPLGKKENPSEWLYKPPRAMYDSYPFRFMQHYVNENDYQFRERPRQETDRVVPSHAHMCIQVVECSTILGNNIGKPK